MKKLKSVRTFSAVMGLFYLFFAGFTILFQPFGDPDPPPDDVISELRQLPPNRAINAAICLITNRYETIAAFRDVTIAFAGVLIAGMLGQRLSSPVGERFVLVVVIALPTHVVPELAPGDQFIKKRFDLLAGAPPTARATVRFGGDSVRCPLRQPR